MDGGRSPSHSNRTNKLIASNPIKYVPSRPQLCIAQWPAMHDGAVEIVE